MFEKVPVNGLVDVRVLKGEEYDGNFLLAKRVLGNPQPESRTLGALIVDGQQADVLAKALATVKQEFELDHAESLIVANMIEAVEQLAHVTANAKFEVFE